MARNNETQISRSKIVYSLVCFLLILAVGVKLSVWMEVSLLTAYSAIAFAVTISFMTGIILEKLAERF